MKTRLAKIEDIVEIKKLLAKNHVDNMSEEEKKDGFVTTNMTDKQMQVLIETEAGITVAEDDDKIIAFAMAGSWEFWKEWPFFANMIEILSNYTIDGEVLSVQNSYQYGPICIEKAYRGQGVFEKVFKFSLESMKDRFPYMVTFVNQINPRSYNAHSNKVGMTTAGKFDYNNNHYYLLACRTGEEIWNLMN